MMFTPLSGIIIIVVFTSVFMGFLLYTLTPTIIRFFIISDERPPTPSSGGGRIRCKVCGAFNFRHNCVDKAWKILQAPNLMDVTLKQEAEEKKRLEILEKQRQEKELEKQLGVDNYRQLKAVRHVMPEYLRKLDKENKEKDEKNEQELRLSLEGDWLRLWKDKHRIGRERANIRNMLYGVDKNGLCTEEITIHDLDRRHAYTAELDKLDAEEQRVNAGITDVSGRLVTRFNVLPADLHRWYDYTRF